MADSLDEYYYLEEGFNPKTLTVAQLRGILLAHAIDYRDAPKKADLVDLFNEQLLPQRAKLLKAQARTKPSTRGITDVPSSQESTVDDEEEEPTLVPPPSTRRTSRRTRGGTEEAVQRTVAPTPRKVQSVVPTKHDRALDAEADERPPPRRTRHSVTPAVPREPSEPETWHRHNDDSPFTNENPFQSGSSPPAPSAKSVLKDRRRKTTGVVEPREKRKSEANRRRTGQPSVEQFDSGIVVPSRPSFEVRSSKYPQESDSVEPGEEFTPEEQLELVREKARTGQFDILPPRRRKQPSKAMTTLKTGARAVGLAFLLGCAAVWRQQKLDVGYCGLGKEPTTFAGVDIPEWANAIVPQCEPCPPNAFCFSDLKTDCYPDFVLKPHPLSFGGLVPLPPTCEPDSEKQRRITAVADKAVEVLRKRRAKYECGETDSAGEHVHSPGLSENQLKDELSSMKRKGMSQEDFDALWKSAIGEVEKKDEIEESTERITGERLFTSTSYAGLSLSCALKRWLRESFKRHLRQLASVVLIGGLALYSWSSFTTSRKDEERAKYLAGVVFDRLANQAALNSQEPGANPDLGVSMSQLRDDILRNEFSSKKRHQLWTRVQKKVEHNANVRAAVKEARGGDISRVWEWVGPVQLLEDGRSTGKRESSRFSVGPGFGSSPPAKAAKERQSLGWDESRPIY